MSLLIKLSKNTRQFIQFKNILQTRELNTIKKIKYSTISNAVSFNEQKSKPRIDTTILLNEGGNDFFYESELFSKNVKLMNKSRLDNYLLSKEAIDNLLSSTALESSLKESSQHHLNIMESLADLTQAYTPKEKLDLLNKFWLKLNSVQESKKTLAIDSDAYFYYLKSMIYIVNLDLSNFKENFNLIQKIDQVLEQMNVNNLKITSKFHEVKFRAFCLYTSYDKDETSQLTLKGSKYGISIQETLEQVQLLKKIDVKLNLNIFNSLIIAYLQIGQEHEAKNIIDLMSKRNMLPNETTYTILLSNYLCDLKSIDKCNNQFKELITDGNSVHFSFKNMNKILTKAIYGDVETSLVIDFLKIYYNIRKTEFVSKYLFESALASYLRSNTNERKVESVDFFLFTIKTNEEMFERISKVEESKVEVVEAGAGKQQHVYNKETLLSTLKNYFELFGKVLGKHENFEDVKLILNKLNEKLDEEKNKGHFQHLFNKLSFELLNNQKYKNLIDLLQEDKLRARISLSNNCVSSILTQILNKKEDFDSLKEFLTVLKKFDFFERLKKKEGPSLSTNALNGYNFEEIVKLNQFLFTISRNNNSTTLITEDLNTINLKKLIYSIQINTFLTEFLALVRLNDKSCLNFKEISELYATLSDKSAVFKYFDSQKLLDIYLKEVSTFGFDKFECDSKLDEILFVLVNDLVKICNINQDRGRASENISSFNEFKTIDFLFDKYFRSLWLIQNGSSSKLLSTAIYNNLTTTLNDCLRIKVPQTINYEENKSFMIDYLIRSLTKSEIKVTSSREILNEFKLNQNLLHRSHLRSCYEFFDELNANNSEFSFNNISSCNDSNRLLNLYKRIETIEPKLIDELNNLNVFYNKAAFEQKINLVEMLFNIQVTRRYIQEKANIKNKLENNIDFMLEKLSSIDESKLCGLTKWNIFNYKFLLKPNIVTGHKINKQDFIYFIENYDKYVENTSKVYLSSCFDNLFEFYIENGHQMDEKIFLLNFKKIGNLGLKNFKNILNKKKDFNNEEMKNLVKLAELVEWNRRGKNEVFNYKNVKSSSPNHYAIYSFLKENKLDEAINYFKYFTGDKEEKKVLSLNLVDHLMKKNEFARLQDFVNHLSDELGTRFSVNLFFFGLLFNNYKEKAKLLLEQHPKQTYSSKRLLSNFIYVLNNFKFDQNATELDNVLDFVVNDEINKAINVEDFFVILFNFLIKSPKNSDKINYFAEKYKKNIESLELVKNILDKKEADNEYENIIMVNNYTQSADHNIEDYCKSVKDKKRSQIFFNRSFKNLSLHAKNQYLLKIAESCDGENIKMIESLSQSSNTLDLNYCRFHLAFAYCKASQVEKFVKKYLSNDDNSYINQYFELIRSEPVGFKTNEHILFNKEFFVFNKICSLEEEVMKKLYDSFLTKNKNAMNLAALFAKYYLVNSKLSEFKFIYSKFNLNNLLNFPITDVVEEDVKNSNVSFGFLLSIHSKDPLFLLLLGHSFSSSY